MTELERYLAEEVVEDHADGIISRREAFRRLGMLGVGAGPAATLLAAFPQAVTAAPASTTAAAVPPPALPTEAITYPGPDGRTLMGAWATAESAAGGVLVIHENRGLTDHIRTVAGRFAASGYAALAVDLLSEEGGTGSFADPAEATAALNRAAPERFVADMKATLSEIERRVPDRGLAATGFCFGGAMTWRLLASDEPRLAAAAPFYGPFPENGDLSESRAAVLGMYAELDARVNATRETARTALEQAGLAHDIVTVPGVDHAFFNDTGARYVEAAALQAYGRVLGWFGRSLVQPAK